METSERKKVLILILTTKKPKSQIQKNKIIKNSKTLETH